MSITKTSCGRGFWMGRLFLGLRYVAVVAIVAAARSALAGVPCPCDGDANIDGVVDQSDVDCYWPLYWGGPVDCPNMDVNCDGVSDFCDFSAVPCQIHGGGPECCDVPCGACCMDGGQMEMFGCLQTSEWVCDVWGYAYMGDGVPCLPSPCDCQPNGTPDGEDIANGTSDDCNGNGFPDECEIPPPSSVGACCLEDLGGCSVNDEALCLSAGGVFYGICTTCPVQNLQLVDEPGGEVFVHVIGPPIECEPPGPAAARACVPGAPKIDPWESSVTCHNFGAPGAGPIPADFFGPGSDPFAGLACLDGVPLGVTAWGDFGNADTLIERSADPFDRCSLPTPTPQTVDIEIVALSLESTSPITVTYNGGQNPEDWDVDVDLSTVTPLIFLYSLTATKTHCNGGMYTSELTVCPRFTFSKVGDPGTQRVFDMCLEGWEPIILLQSPPDPWVHDVDPLLFPAVDPCSDFHAGINDPDQIVDCDCQPNGVRDKCDIEGASNDTNGNGVPDECEIAEACCLPNGDCVMVPEVDCIALGGVPQGVGTVCTTTQACCFPDDTCAMVDPLCCDDLGGTAQGSGSTCGGMQACCDAVGACYMADRTCCLGNSDTPKGAGTVCLGDADGNGVDDACEDGDIPTVSQWGLAVLALLLVVGGKLYFGWRRSQAIA